MELAHSLHGAVAARRQAITELLFFASVGDRERYHSLLLAGLSGVELYQTICVSCSFFACTKAASCSIPSCVCES